MSSGRWGLRGRAGTGVLDWPKRFDDDEDGESPRRVRQAHHQQQMIEAVRIRSQGIGSTGNGSTGDGLVAGRLLKP